ncbi:SLBB domain-containing protein [Rubrivirga sp.]|uniref:SLBB domain-containing protein n=1 Tax=Rubrivirga sp. TaxID=1885344 RepID=UPI003B528660
MRALAVLAVLLSASASAQPAPERGVLGLIEGRQASAGGYYFNAQPGQPTTRVHVWGRVLRPGVYDVGPDFDLGGVLTLAGVSSERDPLDGDPETVLRLYRAGETAAVYQAPLATFLSDPAPPGLRYGDVVEVEAVAARRVAVLGGVGRPGTYEVGPSFSARDALALAGGPELQPLRDNESRETTVRIYRGADTGPAYQEPLAAFLSGPAPALEDGDVIEVETRVRGGWTNRDTFAVAGIVTSGVIAVVQFLRLLDVD